MASEKREMCHIYLTPEEKAFLTQKARESGEKSLSSYIRKKAFAENEVAALSFSGLFETNELFDGAAERNRFVKTSLSEEEFQYVKKIAGTSTISAFLRKLLLNANSGKFTFEVKTDDLSDLRLLFSDFNAKIEGIIGALRYRSELYSSDIATMKKLLEDVNLNVKKILTTTMTDRRYVRKKGIKYLHEQIDKILSVKNDFLK